MSVAILQEQTVSPVEALWTLFKGQPKSIREAFTKRLLKETADAETMQRKKAVKRSLKQAMAELKVAEREGIEKLPDARNLFD